MPEAYLPGHPLEPRFCNIARCDANALAVAFLPLVLVNFR
jgi:hypothetical protein